MRIGRSPRSASKKVVACWPARGKMLLSPRNNPRRVPSTCGGGRTGPMLSGCLLAGVFTALLRPAISVAITGPGWGTVGVYVLGGNLGLLLSAALPHLGRLLGPARR